MRFQIIHTTRYLYEPDVFLEPHTFRLRPRNDPYQHLHHYSLGIRPQPTGQTEAIDLDGNTVAVAWFGNLIGDLTVTARSTVDTLCENPFNFIVTEPQVLRTPVEYPADLRALLEPYRRPSPGGEPVAAFATQIAQEVGGHTPEFINLLTKRIAETCRSVTREGGLAHSAAVTLEHREGACRDLAVLYIECCRSVGLAARFVSGYHEAEGGRFVDHMHAWAEVYLPGGGWRGYDPSTGLAVSDRHVALAAGADAGHAAPIVGTLRGNKSCSSMYAEVQIEVTAPEE